MPEIRYTTHNMYYAAYLVFMGFECVGMQPSTYKAGFYDFGFEWIGDVKSYETNFFNNLGRVEPRAYTEIINNLRDMLNNKRAEDGKEIPYK